MKQKNIQLFLIVALIGTISSAQGFSRLTQPIKTAINRLNQSKSLQNFQKSSFYNFLTGKSEYRFHLPYGRIIKTEQIEPELSLKELLNLPEKTLDKKVQTILRRFYTQNSPKMLNEKMLKGKLTKEQVKERLNKLNKIDHAVQDNYYKNNE